MAESPEKPITLEGLDEITDVRLNIPPPPPPAEPEARYIRESVDSDGFQSSRLK